MTPNDNYFGIEFVNAFWEDVRACCIIPPDAAFRNATPEWEDAEGHLISPPEGYDGHRIIILWRMDEPEEQRQLRPRLHAILAAFAHLYRRRVERHEALRMVLVRFGDKSSSQSDVPPVNFRLWHNSFSFISAFMLEQVEGREYEKTLPAALPPVEVSLCEAAHEEWRALVNARLEYLLSVIDSAESYEALNPTLDEWRSYAWQLLGGYDAALEARCERLRFRPWYPEVLRRMPGLNKSGLCIVPLESIGRYALLDYRPEEGRRFCYDSQGSLCLAAAGEAPLPYDAEAHVHLLPMTTAEPQSRIPGVASAPWCFEESWL